VAKPANVNFRWSPTDSRDANLWQDVEFNRYNNRLLDTSRYSTPAHFTTNDGFTNIVHAPSNHGLQIISPATTTVSSFSGGQFLDIEDENYLFPKDQDVDLASDDYDIEKFLQKNKKNAYSFLGN
jgi:hypothetical protein